MTGYAGTDDDLPGTWLAAAETAHTVMLGGLKVSEKQDLHSSIPIVDKVPIVRFLFQRQGTYAANQKLLILVTATIVIPQEHEPTPAQSGL